MTHYDVVTLEKVHLEDDFMSMSKRYHCVFHCRVHQSMLANKYVISFSVSDEIFNSAPLTDKFIMEYLMNYIKGSVEDSYFAIQLQMAVSIFYGWPDKNPITPVPKTGINPQEAGVFDLPGIYSIVKHPLAGKTVILPNDLEKTFPENHTDSIKAIVIWLNDIMLWTREQIADWLDEIHDPTGETGPNLSFNTEMENENAEV